MRIAIAVFDGAEELDFAGPWEVLTAWRFLYPDDVDVVLVGENREPVTCAKGMRVLPETCWDQLGDVDVLSIPAAAAPAHSSGTRRFGHGCAASRSVAR